MDEKKLTLIEHLEELRKRLIISLVALFSGMIITFVFWQETVFYLIKGPLQQLGQDLVFLSVTEGFILQIKIAFLGGLIIASPVILWQIIAFVLPALYQKEKKVFWSIFLSSLFLFILGVVFAYKVVLVLGLKFLLVNFSGGLTPMLSASRYLSFFLAFLLPFGVAFEIPVATYLLTRVGVLTPQKLRQKRRYVILVIFILAALLTPPDVISQILLALPMLVLYEISIIISFFATKR
ncbi:MAG: twin-arginine translocase subunit TatC [Clostridia bacterium]|nr:twin-arginine translocase subunit TatC [Clostridia bacterium]